MITRIFSFLDADMDDISRSIIEIKEPSYPVCVSKASLKIDLSCVDYGALVTKMVLWTPQEKQTVMYGNQGDGFDTLCYVLNLRYGYDVTKICLTLNPENKIDDEIYDMRFFYHLGRDRSERLARVMQDPRWDFYEKGEPFPFEQTEKYKERIKKKRLTNDMILDYAEAMGYDVRNPDFWKSDSATYLEWSKIPVEKQK